MADSLEIASVKTVKPDIFKSPSEIPVDQLAQDLKTTREYFFDSVEQDCRGAQGFIDEWLGKRLYTHFNDSWEDFCLEHIGRSAQWISHIADGLKLLDNTKPVPASEAIRAVQLKETTAPDRKRQPLPETLEKTAKAKELREQGMGNTEIADEMNCTEGYVRKLLSRTDTCNNVTCIGTTNKTDRPSQRGNSTEYRLSLLERDAPEIAARVKSGEITVNQGMKLAGKVKSKDFTLGPKTDLDALAQKLLDHNQQLAVALAEA
ncbi:MAG: hypothetical protein ACO390_01090, partial [bacterium]